MDEPEDKKVGVSKQEVYKLAFDGQDKNVMLIEIPLKQVAYSAGKMDAQVYLRGFFAEACEQALFWVKWHRQTIQKTSVILPRTMEKADLKVH